MRLRRHLVALVAAAATVAAALAVSQPTPVAAATGGSITIVLDTNPADGTDVGFTGCQGAGCGPFTLDDDANPTLADRVTATGLAAGTYTITQDAVPGWALTSLSCSTTSGVTKDVANRRATIALAAGVDITCTFTNQSPSITIVQDTSPDDGRDFSYTGCLGAGCGSFDLDDDVDPTLTNTRTGGRLAPGTYTITQGASAPWSLTGITCSTSTGITKDVPNRRVTIVLTHPTDHPVCTFTDITQSITIVEDDLTDSGQDHTFTGCGNGGCSSFTLDDDTDPTRPRQLASGPIPTGTYTLTQEALSGWELTDLTCAGEATDLLAQTGTITLTAGEHRTCTFANRPTPTPLDGVAQLTGGGTWHACARLTNGQARCWGNNPGNGVEGPAAAPVVVQDPAGTGPLTGVVDIVSGYSHTCAVLEDTTAVCWGTNIEGELGNGQLDKDDPALLPVVVQNEQGTGPLIGVESLAIGWYHVCAVLVDGEARCWGGNSHGQLGSGATSTRSLLPVTVMDEDGDAALHGVDRLAAGLGYTCALLDEGGARCWGMGGNLGDGRSTDSVEPVTVLDDEGSGPLGGITDLSSTWQHTCATLDNGSAVCWGWVPTATSQVSALDPQPVGSGVTDITSISAGEQHTCFSTLNAGVLCWGQGFRGVLGNGSTTTGSSVPVPVLDRFTGDPLSDVRAVSIRYHTSCAVLATGQARCWGEHAGDGTQIERAWAVPVIAP